MSRQHHYLKIQPEYYMAIEKGIKNFELRKNDRNYQPYDMIHLQEYFQGELTGRELPPIEIKYIHHGGKYGLDPEYCILGW